MIIDCDRCDVRGTACADCVIGVLIETHEDDRPIPYLPVDVPGRLASPGAGRAEPLELAEPERRALEILADQGLIPRLRLVPRPVGGTGPDGGAWPADSGLVALDELDLLDDLDHLDDEEDDEGRDDLDGGRHAGTGRTRRAG